MTKLTNEEAAAERITAQAVKITQAIHDYGWLNIDLESHEEQFNCIAGIVKLELAEILERMAGPRLDVDMSQLVAQEILDYAFRPVDGVWRLNFTTMKAIIAKWWPNMTAGLRPRCPKCKSEDLFVDCSAEGFLIECQASMGKHKWRLTELSDFAQFFAAAPAEDTQEE